MKAAQKPTEKGKASTAFTKEEREAMRERMRELNQTDGAAAVREAIAALPQPDRCLAERADAIVRKAAPALAPKTWYGMPAYARDGNVVCFIQPANKFKARYATLGFNDKAKLDDGRMWAVGFAITEIGAAEKARITALVKQAVS